MKGCVFSLHRAAVDRITVAMSLAQQAATSEGCTVLLERRRLLDELVDVAREAADDIVGAVDSDDRCDRALVRNEASSPFARWQ